MSHCFNYSISELEHILQESLFYVEFWSSGPTLQRDERQFGFAKAVIEFVPSLITLLKLQQTRALEVKDDHLWQEIDRLEETVARLKSSFNAVSPEPVCNINHHKPDPRLVFEEDFK